MPLTPRFDIMQPKQKRRDLAGLRNAAAKRKREAAFSNPPANIKEPVKPVKSILERFLPFAFGGMGEQQAKKENRYNLAMMGADGKTRLDVARLNPTFSAFTEGYGGGGVAGTVGKKSLTRLLNEMDESGLAEKGYKIITPQNLEDLSRYIFGERSVDTNLPIFNTLRARLGRPTIIKEGVDNPDIKDIIVWANNTVEGGYGRTIENAQTAVKDATGRFLTRKQMEDMLGINIDQATVFGNRVGDAGYEISDDAVRAAEQTMGAFKSTWPGARWGSRVLGIDATKALEEGAFDLLTGSTFKNIGAQGDHIKSPTDAGEFIGRKIIAPALARGKTTVGSAGEELAQEINKATQNVEQIVYTPQPGNLNKGAIDIPLWQTIPLITRRLGRDLVGMADESSDTYQRYLRQRSSVWDNNLLDIYNQWYSSPEQVAQQVKRLQNRIRGNF